MKKILLLAILSSLMFSLIAIPMWDNPVAIRQGDNLEWSRCSALTADGCMIYVWSGTKRGDGDIYAQKVDLSGNTLWQEPLLIDGNSFKQSQPVITRTTDNNFVIAWLDYAEDWSRTIKAQKITSYGQLLWTTNGITICSYPIENYECEIAADNNSGAYLVWIDKRGQNKSIYGQHLDNYGNSLWSIDGQPLIPSDQVATKFAMAVDTAGALVVSYFGGYENRYLKTNRIYGDGTPAWTNPVQIVSNTQNNHLQMTAINDSAFVVTWINAYPSLDGAYAYAQRVNHNGTLGWANPVTTVTPSSTIPNIASNPRIVKTSDNAVIIAWEDRRYNNTYADIYVQKISADGNILWNQTGVPVCTEEYYQVQPRLTSNNNGGCFITWEDNRTSEHGNADIYAQNVSMFGDLMWTAQGLAVCTSSQIQHAPVVRTTSNSVMIAWMDYRNGTHGLYYQVISRLGVPQLAPNGVTIHQGMTGSVYNNDYISIPRSNDVAILWSDGRRESLGAKIYLQFVNSDRSMTLAPNGIPIVDSDANYEIQNSISAVVTPDDNIGIVWKEDNRVKAQLIDSSGNRLWGNNGIYLTDTEHIGQNNPKISYEDGAFYIGWVEYAETLTANGYIHLGRIYGQKIVNAQKQWGADGMLISESNPLDTNYEETINYVKGRYFVWIYTSFADETYFQSSIRVKLVDPNGSPAPGWSDAGLTINPSISEIFYNQISDCLETNNGLFVVWNEIDDSYIYKLKGQSISENGTVLWNQGGILINSQTGDAHQVSIAKSHNDLLVIWSSYTDDEQNYINGQKYDAYANPLWGDGGVSIMTFSPFTYAFYPKAVVFDNGGILVTWEHIYDNTMTFYYDIEVYYRYLNPDGSFANNSPAYPLYSAPDHQTTPLLAKLNNSAILTWLDSDFYKNHDRCDEEALEQYNLYAQKLSNDVVANIDDTTPIANLSLEQNFPNPFNPETDIRFSLKQNSDVELNIYNLKGQKVKTLHKGMLDKGKHQLKWKGTDDNDKPVTSGVYLYRLSSGSSQQTRKMVLLK